MPIYNFTNDLPKSLDPKDPAFRGDQTFLIGRKLTPTLEKQVNIADSPINYAPEEVREVATKGFFALDDGFKNWLSGIKVPIMNGYKIVSVHVVNQDKSILAWTQEFVDGRVSLPIISVQRTGWNFDAARFTPPYAHIAAAFVDSTLRRKRLIYRPIPFKVDYTAYIWSEFKQDAEYISSHIIKRCSPLGEFYVEDEYYSQIARVKFNGVSDNSDIDVSKDKPKVIYNLSFALEYALPINEKIVPTVLGRVAVVKESPIGELFDVYRIDDF